MTVIVAAPLLLGCTGQSKTSPDAGINDSAAKDVSSKPGVCVDRRLRCLSVGTDRFALIYPARGQRKKPAPVLYLDAGGPGLEPIDSKTLRTSLPSWTRPYTIATLVEPSAYLARNTACEAAVSASGATGKTNPRRQASITRCDWAAWREDPARAIAKIERAVGPIRGVYATSFGAVRSLAVMHHIEKRRGFAVLDAPSPTPDVPGPTILAQRWALATSEVVRVPHCDKQCQAARRIELREFLNGTPQLSKFEAQLGLLGLMPRLEANKDFLAQFWGHSNNLSRRQVLAWRKSAHAFNRSSSAGEPQPSLTTYLSSICSTYGGWSALRPRTTELAAMHSICTQKQLARGGPAQQSAKFTNRLKLLVTVNVTDPVVPERMQKTWVDRSPRSDLLTYRASLHAARTEQTDERVRDWIKKVAGSVAL